MDGKADSFKSRGCAISVPFTGLPSTTGRLDFLLTFSNCRLLPPTPAYTLGLLSEFFPTITPEYRLIFFTRGPESLGCTGVAIKGAGLLPDARVFDSKLATDPTVATLLRGVAVALELEGSPFPSRMLLSSFALGACLGSSALDPHRVSLLKPSVVAGLEGGGFFSFSKASERFERPVYFDRWRGSPGPSDEAGFTGDGNLGICRLGSDDGFTGEEAGALSIVFCNEDEVGIVNEKDFL